MISHVLMPLYCVEKQLLLINFESCETEKSTRKARVIKMAKVKVALDTRSKSKNIEGKFPLVLRISHKRKTRDISFKVYLKLEQYDEAQIKFSGIQNAVSKSKRVKKTYSEIDLWLDDNKAEIKLWSIAKLKDTIERKFFKKQSELTLLEEGAKVIYRLKAEERFSTASSYESALKIFVKYRMKQAKKDDKVSISTLFVKSKENMLLPKDEFRMYDLPIKAFDIEYAKNFKAYLSRRVKSKNSVNIHLRSLQVILNDAEDSHIELKGHKPLEKIKKISSPNEPVVLDRGEIHRLRSAIYPEGTSKFHVRNYFLFMFNNMGMNFTDIALAKVKQFNPSDLRFSYTRKKTETEGDHFHIKQNQENLEILKYYMEGKSPDDYLFPIIPASAEGEDIFKKKNDKLHWFNDNLKKITTDIEIDKNVTSYAARDTWTNIGLQMGIDIRKISSGLGHSSIDVTEKHYSQKILENILDEVNAQITGI